MDEKHNIQEDTEALKNFTSLVELLRLARIEEKDVRDDLEMVETEIEDLLNSTKEGRAILNRRDNLISAKDLAKTATKTRYDEVKDTATALAKRRIEFGWSPWGRGFHPSVQVQKGAELNILDIGRAVEWLRSVDKSDIVSIKLRGNTGFFRNSSPPPNTLELVDVPLIKVDSSITPLVVPEPPGKKVTIDLPDDEQELPGSDSKPSVRETLGGGKRRRV